MSDLVARLMTACSRTLVAVYALCLGLWYAQAEGLRDLSGTPVGADFINVYAAGVMVWRGQAAQVYDWGAHRAVENAVAGYDAPYYAWHYPPLFLFVAALVGLLPYVWGLGVYLAAGFAGYVGVIRHLVPRGGAALWGMIAFPGVFDTISNGQNGFITTSLLGAGVLWLETQPWLAGLMFGLLSYKPQFFVVIPVLLVAGGYWRVLAATLLTSVAGATLGLLVFGWDVWGAFFHSTGATQHFILEQGATGWRKIQSVFSLARLWGADVPQAYAAQAVVGVVAFLMAIRLWAQRRVGIEVKAAALCAAMLCVTPYALDYDLVLLAVPIALLARRGWAVGFRPYEKALLGALWFLPLVARQVGDVIIVTPFLMLALLAFYFFSSTTGRSNSHKD